MQLDWVDDRVYIYETLLITSFVMKCFVLMKHINEIKHIKYKVILVKILIKVC